MDEEPRFEDALAGLEHAVAALESGDLGLDEALKCYEQGVRLLVRCQSLLATAARKVAVLTGVDNEGRPLTDSFDGSATLTREIGDEHE